MIKWYSVQSKINGFEYFPLLEMSVGIFLMISALIVPLLFLIYNGIKLEQWGELLFCAVFLLFFMFMGKSLTFQSMKVSIENEDIKFYQNLREPPVVFQVSRSDWLGIATSEIIEGNQTYIILSLKLKSGIKEFYRSVNRKEIKKMGTALTTLAKSE